MAIVAFVLLLDSLSLFKFEQLVIQAFQGIAFIKKYLNPTYYFLFFFCIRIFGDLIYFSRCYYVYFLKFNVEKKRLKQFITPSALSLRAVRLSLFQTLLII